MAVMWQDGVSDSAMVVIILWYINVSNQHIHSNMSQFYLQIVIFISSNITYFK